MATVNMHMKFEIEIPKQTWLMLRKPCRLQTDGRTDGQTDRRTDKVNPVYPPSNFVGRGYKEARINLSGWIHAVDRSILASTTWIPPPKKTKLGPMDRFLAGTKARPTSESSQEVPAAGPAAAESPMQIGELTDFLTADRWRVNWGTCSSSLAGCQLAPYKLTCYISSPVSVYSYKIWDITHEYKADRCVFGLFPWAVKLWISMKH